MLSLKRPLSEIATLVLEHRDCKCGLRRLPGRLVDARLYCSTPRHGGHRSGKPFSFIVAEETPRSRTNRTPQAFVVCLESAALGTILQPPHMYSDTCSCLHGTTKEREWWLERKIDPLIIARALWKESQKHLLGSALTVSSQNSLTNSTAQLGTPQVRTSDEKSDKIP